LPELLRYFLLLSVFLFLVPAKAKTITPSVKTGIPAALRDTSTFTVLKPSAAKEQEVFSDSRLKYKQHVKAGPGAMESLMQALSRLLFDDASAENLIFTRQLIIWTVVIISLLIIVRLLTKSQFGRLTRTTPKLTGFNFNDITEDLSAINYGQRIEEALRTNNYRLAIRWHYLEMLYFLDKKQLIVFAPYKTNIDYRYELKTKTVQGLFTALSRIYDYVWYGQFVISENDYLDNAGIFQTLKKELNV